MKIKRIESREVDFIPEQLKEGVLYVSHKYTTAVHKCCCGCGQEVVTPLSPRDWNITPGKGGIRLSPSIGNWSYPCRSHYWIWDGKVVWSEQWSQERIEAGRIREHAARESYYAAQQQNPGSLVLSILAQLWNTLMKWLQK